MFCINVSHPQFKALLEESGLHPDILKAKVSIWMEENTSDSFPSMIDLQLSQTKASDIAADPMTEWLEEFNKEEEDFVVQNKPAGELITDFYEISDEWEHQTDRDQTTEIDDTVLFNLMNDPSVVISPENRNKLAVVAKAVGKQEAYRDYFEQNGIVRPPSIVLNKLEERYAPLGEQEIESFFEREPEVEDDFIEDFQRIVQTENSKKAINKIQKLSSQLGIEVEIVLPEELKSRFGITQSGVKGFFKNGKVYLIDGAFTEATVFHEFCHPIIKSMANQNPDLFLALYQEVLNTPEGQQIFKKLTGVSSDYTVNSPEFMEEVIVEALDQKNQVSKSVIQNILFQIKQFLRKVLGKKINISKLETNTSLTDMLDMINEGGEFILDKDFLAMDDIIMFSKEYDEQVEAIYNTSKQETQLIIDNYYAMVSEQLGNLLKSESAFAYIKSELATDNFDGELQTLRKMLDALTTSDKSKMANLSLDKINAAEVDLIKNKIEAYVSSLVQGGKVLEIFEKKIKDLEVNSVVTNQDFDTLFALETYVSDWVDFLNKLKAGNAILQEKTASKPKIKISSIYSEPKTLLQEKINDLSTTASKLADRIVDLKVNSIIEPLFAAVYPKYQKIEQQFLESMAAAKKTGNLSGYNNLHEEYYGLTLEELEELNFLKTQSPSIKRDERIDFLSLKKSQGTQLTKEGLKNILANKLGDSQWMNGMFESNLLNQDKVVSSFADYINNFLQEVNGNVNAIEADFLEGLQPLLKAAGFDNTFFGQAALGKAIQHTNISFEKDEDGNVTEFEEYAFASNFTGHEFELEKLNENLKKAKEQWQYTNDDNDYILYIKAKFELDNYHADYMTQDNIPEYYEANKLFRTDAGIEATKRRDAIFTEMRLLKENFLTDPTNTQANAELKRLWYEYQQMQSLYDLDGKEKTGIDLEVAKIFKAYGEQTKDFHTYEEIEGLFDSELEKLENYLIDVKKYKRGSEAFDQARKIWIKNNTTVELKDDYFDTRAELLEKKQTILAKLISVNKKIADTTPLYEKIFAILKKTKNDVGEYDGNLLTNAEQETITDLHKEIIEAEQTLYTLSGLTKEEHRHFAELKDSYDYYNKHRTLEDKLDYERYQQTLLTSEIWLDITEAELEIVREIDKELRSMVISESTGVYINQFLELAKLNNDSFKILEKFVYDVDSGTELKDGDLLTHEHIEKLLEDMTAVMQMCDKNLDFKKWFDRNHYSTLIPYRDENGVVDGEQEIYRKSAAWQYTKPSESNMYKKKYLYSKTTGGLIGFLEVDGVFRVPNISFKARTVKPEYKTEIIERDFIDDDGNLVLANVDNRGRFLPRENGKDDHLVDANYKKMFKSNRKLFDLMLYTKNQYLDNQKGLDNSQKRYLTYPAIRRPRAESRRSFKSMLRRGWDNIIEVFSPRVDDFEEGIQSFRINRTDRYNTLTRPISGNYKLNKDFVSLNIINSMGVQLFSIEKYKALRKANSVANLLKSTIEHHGASPSAQKIRNKVKTLLRFTDKGDNQRINRLNQIDAIIAKNFQGEQLVSVNSKAIRSAGILMNKLAAWNSFRAFVFGLYSSSKNFIGGEGMLIMKAASDTKLFNLKHLLLAAGPAAKAEKEILKSSFSNKQKSADLQLIYLMEAVPGLYERRVGDAGSKTVSESIKKLEFGFVDRKILTDSVSLHQFYAILLNNKFNLNGKKVALHKAVELVNGRIQTKSGVPAEYSITYNENGAIVLGQKIKDLMNLHQGVLLKTVGMVNDFGTAEVYRYLGGKFANNMVRFFIPMEQDRAQIASKKGFVKDASRLRFKKRVNLYTQRAEIGTMVGTLEAVKLLMQQRSFKSLPYSNKVAILATIMLYAAKELYKLAISSIRFNTDDDDRQLESFYDPEDEHRHKKLISHTGLPNLPFISDRYTTRANVKYDSSDYWKLHLLRLLKGGQKELNTFDPLEAATTFKDIITFNSPMQEGGITEIIDLYRYLKLTWEGKPDNYDRAAGPGISQQQGDNKIFASLLGTVGINFKQLDPATAIKTDDQALERN